MKAYIPNTYDTRYIRKIKFGLVVIPLSGRTSKLPQDLVEEKAGCGNNVCHVKMLSAKLFTESGDPILWGWVPEEEDNRSLYARYFTYTLYMHHTVVHCMCDYLTDTKGQYIGGSRYRWTIQVSCAEESGREVRQLEGSHHFGVFVDQLNQVRPDKYSDSRGMKLSRLAKVLGDYLAYHLSFPRYIFSGNPGTSELIRVFREGIEYYLSTFFSYDGPVAQKRSWRDKALITGRARVNLPSGSLLNKLRLDEYNLVLNKAYSTVPFAAYHIKALQQAAYIDCFDHVPQMNENSLANIAELIQLLKGIIVDHKVDIPDSLSSLWLSYRYTYGTGKSDLEDAIRFQKRVADGVLFHQGFACYGASSQTIDGVSVTCRCRITFRQKELEYLDKISTGLYRYGLSPSFYVIWDMIPYSFIVDWFLPIGDALSAFDKRRMYDRTYDMSDIWFSLKYEFQDSDGSYSAYTRWESSYLPEFQGYYSLENIGTPSNKTIGFRILDALSLIFR